MGGRKYRCPACHQVTGVDILWGTPTSEAVEKAARDEIVLGGCSIDLDGPDRKCTGCGNEWHIEPVLPPALPS